jgi:hypothetical protein
MKLRPEQNLTPTNIQNQVLWFNSDITIDGSPFFFPKWYEKGILYVRDLLDQNGNFLSSDDLNNKFGLESNFLNILQLRQSIPLVWRGLLNVANFVTFEDINGLFIDGHFRTLSQLEGRHIYWTLFDQLKYEDPRCIKKWEDFFQISPEQHSYQVWQAIFQIPFLTCTEPYLQSFQYRLIHRITPCNHWLHSMSITESPNCLLCQTDDTIIHYFIECGSVVDFWTAVGDWLSNLYRVQLNLDVPTILFGSNKTYDWTNQFNYIIIVAKFYLYQSKSVKKHRINFYKFLALLKENLHLKYLYQAKENKVKTFEKQWGHLYES